MSTLLQRGQIFAERYRVGDFLAKGGFGAVYAAEQIETEGPVALKVLWPHVFQSEDAVKQFKLEARVAGRIGSEHVVRVLDVGFDEKTRMPFLAMELLQGQDLERVVESRGPLTPDELVPYFLQIGSALDKAHGYVDKDGAKRPIVHRDLKPENLFVAERDSGGPIIKILDFGIAKVLNADSLRISLDFKGTPLFMASEQASAGLVTPQTDIWSLGLIAFYVLTGEHYWRVAGLPECSMTQVFGEVLSMPLDPPSERAVDVGSSVIPDARFDAWFERCVNRDPTARFPTAGECAAQLASVLADAPRTWRGLGVPRGPRAARLTVAKETAGESGRESAPPSTGDALPTIRSETRGLRRGLGSQQPTTSELRVVRPGMSAARTVALGVLLTATGVGMAMWAKSGGSDDTGVRAAAGSREPSLPATPPAAPVAAEPPRGSHETEVNPVARSAEIVAGTDSRSPHSRAVVARPAAAKRAPPPGSSAPSTLAPAQGATLPKTSVYEER